MFIEKKVELTAKDGKEDELRDLLKHVTEESRKESGCIVFNLFQIRNTKTFVVMEKWVENKDLEAHRLTPHYIKLKNSLDDLTEGEKSSLELIRL